MCGFVTDTREKLRRHCANFHERRFRCTYAECNDKRFSKAQDFKSHMNRHLGDSPYECANCDRRFTSACLRSEHNLKVHGSPDALACTQPGCSFTTTGPRYLRKHMRVHLKKYKCTVPGCGKAFALPAYLAAHAARHDPTLRLTCPNAARGCRYTTTAKHNVTRHLRNCKFAPQSGRVIDNECDRDALPVAVSGARDGPQGEGATAAAANTAPVL